MTFDSNTPLIIQSPIQSKTMANTKLTFNVHFDDSNNSNDKGFAESLRYCKNYIKTWNGSNESYFADYKGGIVAIVCNETGERLYEEPVI